MTLTTAYHLPYKVLIGASAEQLVSSGGALAVTVEPAVPARGSYLATRVATVLDLYTQLASTGALAGASVSPRQAAEGIQVQGHEDGHGWWLRDGHHDPRSLVVLANWIHAVAPESIVALRIGPPPYAPMQYVPGAIQYPALARSSNCLVRMSGLVGENARLVITPRQPLAEPLARELLNRLCTGATAIALGAYAESPSLERGDGCVFEDQFDMVAGDPAFCISRLRADAGAVIGLVNACQAFFEEMEISAEIDVES